MRVAKTALIAGVVLTAATATILKAQQRFAGSMPVAASPPADEAPQGDPALAQRSSRQLLKNGLDYLDTYHDYDRAMPFLREATRRPLGLDDREMKQLADALARAESGSQAAAIVANDPRVKGSKTDPAKPSAWGRTRRPVRDVAVASAISPAQSDGQAVRKASAEMVLAEPAAMDVPVLAPGKDQSTEAAMPAPTVDDAPPPLLPATADAKGPAKAPVAAAPKTASEPIYLTGSAPADDDKDKDKPPADLPPPVEGPATELPPLPAPAEAPASKPETVPIPIPVPVPVPVATLPKGDDPVVKAPVPARLPAQAPLPAPEPTPAPLPADAPPPGVRIPAQPPADAPPIEEAPVTPAPASAPVIPVPVVRQAAAQPRMTPSPRPTEAPASEAEELPPLPVSTASKIVVPSPAPVAPTEIVRSIGSSLSAETLREIEEVARLQDEAMKRNPPPTALGAGTAGDINAGSTSENGGGSRLVLPRPPSPTEARPIRVIPVPEDFVPLPPRQWDPQRKYWAAAATCHMPLYFQDAVLERYGQSVEQAIGPKGRFFSYPLDDPKQSNQRNQLLQPMYSAGLFLGQIALLPYNMLMDPPWEAEYDLGYYRPGDKIPGDTYYLPKTGIGPFLRGNRY